MSLKDHFSFKIGDAKQLAIALMSSYGMWAATGFQRSISGIIYPVMGFITGGLASHNSSSSPNVEADDHIQTPYANNIDDGSSSTPPMIPDTPIPGLTPSVTKNIIKINSNPIKLHH